MSNQDSTSSGYTSKIENCQVVDLRWQPIETAPKDGTRVLVTWAGDHAAAGYVRIAQFCALGGKTRRAWMSDCDSEPGRIMKPSYWQPLPAPPPSPVSV
jgi:hypothetical protein